jgi:hypothetical protein
MFWALSIFTVHKEELKRGENMNIKPFFRKSIYLPIMVVVTGVIIGGTTILASGSSSLTTTKVVVEKEDQLVSVESAMFIPITMKDIVPYADSIVIGKVEEILPAKKIKEPTAPSDKYTIIYQDVIIEVERYLHGTSDSKCIAVRVNGGRVENEVMISEIEPIFTLDEKLVLILGRPLSYQLAPTPEGIKPDDYF